MRAIRKSSKPSYSNFPIIGHFENYQLEHFLVLKQMAKSGSIEILQQSIDIENKHLFRTF